MALINGGVSIFIDTLTTQTFEKGVIIYAGDKNLYIGNGIDNPPLLIATGIDFEIPFATDNDATAGTSTTTVISPNSLNTAMSQFGLFGFSRTTGITDLNELKQTGCYSVGGTTANVPTVQNYHIIVSGQVYEDEQRSVVVQLVISHDNQYFYVRTYGGQIWNTWRLVTMTPTE